MFSKMQLTIDELEEYLVLANELEFGGGSNQRYRELAERLEKFGVERIRAVIEPSSLAIM